MINDLAIPYIFDIFDADFYFPLWHLFSYHIPMLFDIQCPRGYNNQRICCQEGKYLEINSMETNGINIKDIVIHTFDPVYDADSKILILGTMPSVKSREAGFYYMHPQNIFWRILSDLLDMDVPATIDAKRKMLADNGIALWDVLKSCEIKGSLDSSIRKPVPNDIHGLLQNSSIEAIFTTGRTATALFRKYCSKFTGMDSIYLPSTSPANKKYYSYENKIDEWKKILKYIR